MGYISMSDAVREPMPLTDRDGNRLFLQYSNFKTEDIYRNGRKGAEVSADVAITYEDGTPFAVMPPPNTAPIDGNTTGIKYFKQ